MVLTGAGRSEVSGSPEPDDREGFEVRPLPTILVLSVWTDDPETGMRVRMTRATEKGGRRETVWAFSPQEAGAIVRSWLEEIAEGS